MEERAATGPAPPLVYTVHRLLRDVYEEYARAAGEARLTVFKLFIGITVLVELVLVAVIIAVEYADLMVFSSFSTFGLSLILAMGVSAAAVSYYYKSNNNSGPRLAYRVEYVDCLLEEPYGAGAMADRVGSPPGQPAWLHEVGHARIEACLARLAADPEWINLKPGEQEKVLARTALLMHLFP